MCGVSAIFSRFGHLGSSITRLNESIKHRGPDDEGYFFCGGEGVVNAYGPGTQDEAKRELELIDVKQTESLQYNAMLGHRRLSIVDTTWRGHQPMMSDCLTYAISYNGEVYNAELLRSELVRLGHDFKTTTDTEVVLAAYKQWGSSCLEKFNGMFAFIIVNKSEQKVFVARDRYGIKPLYYYFPDSESIALASEIKQFTSLVGWTAKLNLDRAIDYLNWGQTDHTVETLFAGVLQVPAGHFSEFFIEDINGRMNFSPWYGLDSCEKSMPYDQAVTDFKEIFVAAVRDRLRADVPIGTCLSGGLDSSSIACTINLLLGGDQEQVVFSSCSRDKRYDESEYVDAVLEQCSNMEARRIEANHDEFWSELKTLIYHHDEPFLSPSVYAEWCVFREVGETDVKVTLDGHGADEILMGYYTFFGAYLSGLLRTFRCLEYTRAVFSIRSMHDYTVARLLGMTARGFLPRPLKQRLLRLLGRPSTMPDWINLRMMSSSISDIGFSDTQVKQISLDQLLRFSVPKQLKWCDRDSMAHSIESRVPFLDFRLVEFLLSLPDDYKLKRGLTKRVLRDAMKGVIPPRSRNG